jgi:tetratricopeptide (TPR) repeat protein
MAALFARGAIEEALRAGRRAFDLNPYDSDILADLGARQVQLGRYAEGAALITRAAEANPTDPPWYDFFLFLAAYMQGDQAGARAAADRIVAESYALGHVARAVVAVEAGEEDKARQAVGRLVAVQPDYARDPRGALARRRFAPEATARLAGALARAGLTGDAAAR